jgi:hypothetical protein
MYRLILFSIAAMSWLLPAPLAFAQTTPANPPITRTVSGQVLKSKDTPAVRLEFDKQFKYAGGQSFILYDVANAEQHFFVDTDEQGRIKRLFWVQFEGYLPSNTHSYKYRLTKVVNIGGLDFIADAYPRSLKGDTGRPDSDGNRARSFLESKGYRMAGTEIMSQRLVHLVDAAKRNELMIIYIEDLSPLGMTAADFGEGGSAKSRWDEIAKGLLERAMKNMKVTPQ